MAESVDRFKRDSPTPALLRNTVFARWDSVTGPTVVRAWPELAQTGSLFAGDPSLATEHTVLNTDVARFIARNCLTAEVTNSQPFGNRCNARIFSVPEIGLVAYALVFACVPMKPNPKPPRRPTSAIPGSANPVVYFPFNQQSANTEQLCVWFFLFDAAITRVIEMRTVLEETLLTRYIYILRVALTKTLDSNSSESRELVSSLSKPLMEMLDSHAVAFEIIFSTYASCILLPAIRFSSTFFAVNKDQAQSTQPLSDSVMLDQEFSNEYSEKSRGTLGWFRGQTSSLNGEEQSFIRKAISAFLASGGRALVLGHSSKSVNSLINTLAMFLPVHCRRLCRLAAAKPNEKFLPGFYVQGLVGAPYPTGTELLMSHHSLAIIDAHYRTVCRTPPPAKHRLAATAFTAARVRDAWEGVNEDNDKLTQALGALPLNDSAVDESIIGDFLKKLAMCSPIDNSNRQRFVESVVADLYTKACCMMQLVQRSLEQQKLSSENSKQSPSLPVLTKREIAKLLELRKADGDLEILIGLAELLQYGFAEIVERCPP